MSYKELAMPNAETIASIEELENGGGILFTGSTEDLFAELMEAIIDTHPETLEVSYKVKNSLP